MQLGFRPSVCSKYEMNWVHDHESQLILFFGGNIVYCVDGEKHCHFPAPADLRDVIRKTPLQIGFLNGQPCLAVEEGELDGNALPNGLVAEKLRYAYSVFSRPQRTAVARARELLLWRRQHQFCGCCKAPLKDSESDIAIVCPVCGTHYYPQLAPAVIVAITRGNEILLAHNRRFDPGIYGLIAGFVEVGETVEQAIAREVWEEVGIEVGNIRYYSSQSWPFPNSLMLGFTAEYCSGEVAADGVELETAGWFTVDHLPKIPPVGSIAREIIEDFIRRQRS